MLVNQHGGDIYSYIERNDQQVLDFSANINPLGLPAGAQACLKNEVDAFSAYPDVRCKALIDAIGAYEGVKAERIVCGNGAADLIYRLCYALRPKKALLIAPTFSEYEAALQQVDCAIRYHHVKAERGFQVETDILEAIQDVDMVFVCNPNNPTGVLTTEERMLQIARQCKQCGATLVIDECFMGFVESREESSFLPHLSDFPHVLVLKAFTKFFAMAGLRLGYCISANLGLLEKVRKAGQPWSVSTPAQRAGVCALQDANYIKTTVQNTTVERVYLSQGLRRLGFCVFESRCNFILFRIPVAINLYKLLYEKAILIRSCDNFVGLDEHYYRVAVKSHKDNCRLLSALEEVLVDVYRCD